MKKRHAGHAAFLLKKMINNKPQKIIISIFLSIIIFTFNSCSAILPLSNITHEVQEKIVEMKIGKPVVVGSISTEKYAYSCMSDEGKITYDQVLDCVLSHEEEIVLSTKDSNVLDEAVKCIRADYGGLFWFEGYKYKTYQNDDYIAGMTFVPEYTYDRESRDAIQADIDKVVNLWLEELPVSAGDYEKSKFVYEKLIKEVDYVQESENNQNIISVFLNKKTVCNGYACSASYLFSQLGIENIIVTGSAKGESHAWNIIKLDGQYYNFDVTWGNSKYSNPGDSEAKKIINYGYLNVTDEDIAGNHTADAVFPLPECTKTECRYYGREGVYYPYMDGDSVARQLGTAYQAGESEFSVRFAVPDVYNAMKEYLLDVGHFADYSPGLKKISYICDPDVGVIIFIFREV